MSIASASATLCCNSDISASSWVSRSRKAHPTCLILSNSIIICYPCDSYWFRVSLAFRSSSSDLIRWNDRCSSNNVLLVPFTTFGRHLLGSISVLIFFARAYLAENKNYNRYAIILFCSSTDIISFSTFFGIRSMFWRTSANSSIYFLD